MLLVLILPKPAVAFFIANEYLRAQGLPGIAEEQVNGSSEVLTTAKRYVEVARGKLDAEGLRGTS